MLPDRLRLAVFTSQFPGRVNTFFARDIKSLIDAGIEPDIYPLYPPDDTCWSAVPEWLNADVLDRKCVHHIPLSAAVRRASWSAARFVAADLVRTTSSAVPFGVTPVLKTVYSVAKAWAWATTNPTPCDHVLAYWGNYSATAAYVFHRLAARSVPFSIVLHAGTDLYRDQVFLREKLVYADNIFVVCDYNREFLRQLYPNLFPGLDRKIHIHHLPLDLDEYRFEADRSPNGAAQLVAVGGLERAKGFDSLLKALPRVVERHRSVRVLVIGDGPLRAELQSSAEQLGIADRVTFTGWRTPEEARAAIARADILIHPSVGLGDAVPTVIKEALALGTPVIASRITGIPELLDGGRCGVLVPPGDPDRLAGAISTLLESPAENARLRTAGRAYAEAMFDIRHNGPRLAAILAGSIRANHRGLEASARIPSTAAS
jgi:glycosyltransferase involved in cell wall biosynthesis